MSKDYSIPVLTGPGDNDYARYMRTDALLSLQRHPDDMVHRDELLFQTVHQTTELWLKLACYEVEEVTRLLRGLHPGLGALRRIFEGSDEVDAATQLLGRACLGMELITGQLEMLCHLSPCPPAGARCAG
jgi:tryptophan 2,3-dioxygenase